MLSKVKTKSFGGDNLDSEITPRKDDGTFDYEEEVEAAPRGPEMRVKKKKHKKLVGGLVQSPSKADIARSNFTIQELGKFDQVFKMFDSDGNGTLDISEIERVLKQLDKPMSRDEILDLLYDVDLGDTINKDEFVQMMAGEKKFKTRDISHDERRMVKQMFSLFDYDRKGYWTYDEFSQYFGAVDKDAFLEFTEENFTKVNSLLGAKDKNQMCFEQLEMFYTIEDRTMATDLDTDYHRCCE